MGTPVELQRYDQGYRQGRVACLTTGSAEAARALLHARPHRDHAYDAGFEWAVWDYEDANGLPTGRARAPVGGTRASR